jgi:hypothetical protein
MAKPNQPSLVGVAVNLAWLWAGVVMVNNTKRILPSGALRLVEYFFLVKAFSSGGQLLPHCYHGNRPWE